MNFIEQIRRMDPRLRLMLLSTVLLFVPGVGQFVAIYDLNNEGRYSPLAILFGFAGIFIVPTSAILSGVIMATVRRSWREHERLMILGGLNLIISLNLLWFFWHACSWAQIFGLSLQTCTSR